MIYHTGFLQGPLKEKFLRTVFQLKCRENARAQRVFYKDVTSFKNGFISTDSQVQNVFNEAKGSLDTDLITGFSLRR